MNEKGKRFHKNFTICNAFIHFRGIIYQNTRKCLAWSPLNSTPILKSVLDVFDHQLCIQIDVEHTLNLPFRYHSQFAGAQQNEKINMKIQVH